MTPSQGPQPRPGKDKRRLARLPKIKEKKVDGHSDTYRKRLVNKVQQLMREQRKGR